MPPKPIPVEDRFWPKVDRRGPDECWEWQAGTNRAGYGRLRVNGVAELAHRVAYKMLVGPIEGDLCVCHSCDNPPCCNPAHLWLGTRKDNNADMGRKGRAVVPGLTGERHPNVKYSDADIGDIRHRYASGEAASSIAADYGTNRSYIWQLCRRSTRSVAA